MSYVLGTYERSVKENFISGKGSYLYNDKNVKYLDFVQGIAVNALGHNHQALVKAMKSNSEKPWHLSNLFLIQEQEKFAERICKLTGFDAVGFQNSGAEATELAIKAAVKYFYSIGQKEKNRILCIKNSFHGRTIGTISAGNNPKHTEGFPLLNNFDHFEFGNHDEMNEKITDKTCAILCESILGESGIKVIPNHCLQGLRKLCDEKNILLICDEIQSGYFRSGKFFAYQYSNIKPDIVPFAKAVAGGYPVGGCLFTKKIANSMGIGSHGSTFAGSPLAMSLANVVLDIMTKKGFEEHLNEVSKYFLLKLNEVQKDFPELILEVRGRGLMIGIKMHDDPSKFISLLLKNKLIVVKASENVIRLFPSLIVSKEEIDEGIKIINKTCNEYK
jgi:acetylornithine/N-succinyldiaminopimelate aminotransferase